MTFPSQTISNEDPVEMMMSETVTNLELIAKTLYGSPPPCYFCKK